MGDTKKCTPKHERWRKRGKAVQKLIDFLTKVCNDAEKLNLYLPLKNSAYLLFFFGTVAESGAYLFSKHWVAPLWLAPLVVSVFGIVLVIAKLLKSLDQIDCNSLSDTGDELQAKE